MNWYLQNGKDSDVVVSTRIRLARNIAGFKFKLTSREEIISLENKIKDNLFEIGYGLKFFRFKDMDDITKMSLVEKNLISPEFVLDETQKGSILLNEEENICIMVNEEDHLRLQVFTAGLDLENALNLAVEIDEKLAKSLGYAVSKKYGYLTTYPNNCGTGLKASVMLHLPALLRTGNMKPILDTISRFEVNIRGIYGENSRSVGDMFQLSNQKTLGVTEKEIVESIYIIAQKLINKEREARKLLAKDDISLEDKVYRSYGILSNCRKISSEEARELLSDIKLGTDLGILPELNDTKIQKLYLYTKPANMQKMLGNQYDGLERDIKRAEIVKQILEQK